MSVQYDSFHSCNKCGSRNDYIVKDSLESIILQCETVCTVCGFEDYWVTGFFESRQEGYNSSEKYWW